MDAIFAAIEAAAQAAREPVQPVGCAVTAVDAPPPVQAPPVSAPPPTSVPAAKSGTAARPPAPGRQATLQSMFQDGNTLLRAIVASEVLAPPVALRENDHWNQRPNEPST